MFNYRKQSLDEKVEKIVICNFSALGLCAHAQICHTQKNVCAWREKC